MSAHHTSTPPVDPSPTDWRALLIELDRRTRLAEPSSGLPAAWTLHAWANDHLDSAAIRIDGSEGLIGAAPARWRVLVHADAQPGLAVAVLDGRAPLRPANVLASLLVAPERPPVVSVRGQTRFETSEPPAAPEAAAREQAGVRPGPDLRPGIVEPSKALASLVDLALGRCARVSGSVAALPAALRLAAALALSERGAELACTPRRRGSRARRARAFVAVREAANIRRQLAAVEAALRKREASRG